MAKGGNGDPADDRDQDPGPLGDRGRGRAVPADPTGARPVAKGATGEGPAASSDRSPGEDDLGTRKRG